MSQVALNWRNAPSYRQLTPRLLDLGRLVCAMTNLEELLSHADLSELISRCYASQMSHPQRMLVQPSSPGHDRTILPPAVVRGGL